MWKLWPFLVSREARRASLRRNVAKTIAQTVAMWAFFLVIAPYVVFRLEGAVGLAAYRFDFFGRRFAAVVLFTLCGLIGIASGLLMAVQGEGTPLPADCPRRLVIAGPYQYVRNPMAMSSLAQGFCAGVYLGSPLVLAYVAAGALVWNYLARPWEEADLARRFGAPYSAYRRAVRCWLPRLTPYKQPAGFEFPQEL